ncbi:MAG: hypothetical protein LBE22_12215, partial [Azoarcus sp.]|nr:hypothetical protein [Azoarcus sp.]
LERFLFSRAQHELICPDFLDPRLRGDDAFLVVFPVIPAKTPVIPAKAEIQDVSTLTKTALGDLWSPDIPHVRSRNSPGGRMPPLRGRA